jgi:hypothetical protein
VVIRIRTTSKVRPPACTVSTTTLAHPWAHQSGHHLDLEARRHDCFARTIPAGIGENGEGAALVGIERTTARPLSVNARSPAASRSTNPFTIAEVMISCVMPARWWSVLLAMQNNSRRSLTRRPAAASLGIFVSFKLGRLWVDRASSAARLRRRFRSGVHTMRGPNVGTGHMIRPGRRVDHGLVVTKPARDSKRPHAVVAHVSQRHRLDRMVAARHTQNLIASRRRSKGLCASDGSSTSLCA